MKLAAVLHCSPQTEVQNTASLHGGSFPLRAHVKFAHQLQRFDRGSFSGENQQSNPAPEFLKVFQDSQTADQKNTPCNEAQKAVTLFSFWVSENQCCFSADISVDWQYPLGVASHGSLSAELIVRTHCQNSEPFMSESSCFQDLPIFSAS